MKAPWILPIIVTLAACAAAPRPRPSSPPSSTREDPALPGIVGQGVDREQQIIEWTVEAEFENKVGAAVWQKGTWNWQFAANDKATGLELLRTGYDSTHVRIFGDIRIYMTISIHHYLRLEQWARVSTRLVDCKRKVVENWPQGDVIALGEVQDLQGGNVLAAEISAVCAAAPFVESRPVGE